MTASDTGGDVREAHRMWERAEDRVDMRRCRAAAERGDLEPDVDQLDGPLSQLELGLHLDD